VRLADCVCALGSGDELAAEEAKFTALVERQSRVAFRVAYAVLLNAHDAEDAVQETFLKLYRHGGWRQAENERAYVARVVWRCAVDRRRAMQPAAARLEAAPEEALEIAALETAAPQPGASSNPERDAIAADRRQRIHAMIDALPEDLRLPLVLAAFEELNSRVIAGILGIPEGTVRTRLQRARQMLKQKLAALEVRHVANRTANHPEARHAL
jgi:RNA polymerase sigma-70 factor, ECF subfamily